MAIHAGDNNGCGCEGGGTDPGSGTGTLNNVLKPISFLVDTDATARLNDAEVANLINAQGISISELETPVLITVTALGTQPQVRHKYFFGGGKGNWGGDYPDQVTAAQIFYLATDNEVTDVESGLNVYLIKPARDADYYFENAATVQEIIVRHGITSISVSINGSAFVPAVAPINIPQNSDVTWRVVYSAGSNKALFYLKI